MLLGFRGYLTPIHNPMPLGVLVLLLHDWPGDFDSIFRPRTIDFWTVQHVGLIFQIEVAILADAIAGGSRVEPDSHGQLGVSSTRWCQWLLVEEDRNVVNRSCIEAVSHSNQIMIAVPKDFLFRQLGANLWL